MENDIPVPVGFSPITTSDQGTKLTGFVIKNDNDGNEFVWIPVEGMNYTDGAETNPITGYNRYVFLTSQPSDGWDNGTDSLKIKYKTSETDYFIERMPNDELASVNEYGGYYIGRYEAGITNIQERASGSETNTIAEVQKIESSAKGGKPLSQSGKNVYNNVTKFQAEELSSRLYNKTNDNVTSKLCSSYAWDTTLKFIDSNSANVGYVTTGKINGTIIGNYENTETFTFKKADGTNDTKTKGIEKLVTTGQTTPVNNIYDMGGNVYEWTTESCNYVPCTYRGGDCGHNVGSQYMPAERRYTVAKSYSKHWGFRVTLFM